LKPNLQAHVQVEIKDKAGKVVKRYRQKLARSYVRQMIDMLNAYMGDIEGNVVKDTVGDITNIYHSGGYWKSVLAIAGAGLVTYGILCGSGTDAVTISDYYLPHLINHGDTSNKLNYGAVSVGNVAIVGSSAKFTIARTLTNNSGADISPSEVALVLKISDVTQYFMVDHTLFNFTIGNGLSGTVTYTISVTV
jgi:hypothetical protein